MRKDLSIFFFSVSCELGMQKQAERGEEATKNVSRVHEFPV